MDELIDYVFYFEMYLLNKYVKNFMSLLLLEHGLRRVIACQGESMTLTAPKGKVLRIWFAHYGRTSTQECSDNLQVSISF